MNKNEYENMIQIINSELNRIGNRNQCKNTGENDDTCIGKMACRWTDSLRINSDDKYHDIVRSTYGVDIYVYSEQTRTMFGQYCM